MKRTKEIRQNQTETKQRPSRVMFMVIVILMVMVMVWVMTQVIVEVMVYFMIKGNVKVMVKVMVNVKNVKNSNNKCFNRAMEFTKLIQKF